MDLRLIPTPALVLDKSRLHANAAFMLDRAKTLGVKLRPHMKTAKSIDVARVVMGEHSGITVSTLAEARYFVSHGVRDITYAVGLSPARVDEARTLAREGAALKVLTDNAEVAALLACSGEPLDVLIEIDCGDNRGGVTPDSRGLLEVADALRGPGARLAGVLTHAGQSYACRTLGEIADVAETERAAAVRAADRLRATGHEVEIVSVGSTPTATHARNLEGVTEMRPGVYMFGDLDQVGLHSMPLQRVAVSVLASVIGVYPGRNAGLIDAGGLALSKDTSAQRHDAGNAYGRVLTLEGEPLPGVHVAKANQEHGFITSDNPLPFDLLHVGARVRVLPNHICMTAAAHPGYHVVEGTEVIARWPRLNGWEQW